MFFEEIVVFGELARAPPLTTAYHSITPMSAFSRNRDGEAEPILLSDVIARGNNCTGISDAFRSYRGIENQQGVTMPTVSCIMPTFNRAAFVPNAITYFLRQDMQDAELIIIDDGIATGATMLSAARAIRSKKPKKLIVASPVASVEAAEMLRGEVDVLVLLDTPEEFYSISQFYDRFDQVTDDEVLSILSAFSEALRKKTA